MGLSVIRIYLIDGQLVCYDKGENQFKQKYGRNYEQIGIVKDVSNLETSISKLKKQYKVSEVIQDVHIKRKFGWCYWSEEKKAEIRQKMSDVRIGRPRRQWIKDKISESRKGKGNFAGKKHSEFAKKSIAFSRKGKDPIGSKRWCHNPITGKELRAIELPEGFIWGRDKSVLYQFH